MRPGSRYGALARDRQCAGPSSRRFPRAADDDGRGRIAWLRGIDARVHARIEPIEQRTDWSAPAIPHSLAARRSGIAATPDRRSADFRAPLAPHRSAPRPGPGTPLASAHAAASPIRSSTAAAGTRRARSASARAWPARSARRDQLPRRRWRRPASRRASPPGGSCAGRAAAAVRRHAPVGSGPERVVRKGSRRDVGLARDEDDHRLRRMLAEAQPWPGYRRGKAEPRNRAG